MAMCVGLLSFVSMHTTKTVFQDLFVSITPANTRESQFVTAATSGPSFKDVEVEWLASGPESENDRFIHVFWLPFKKLQFAIRYIVNGRHFGDNDGLNELLYYIIIISNNKLLTHIVHEPGHYGGMRAKSF